MAQSSSKHGDASRTLLKIILMLGLVLAGVAAIAAEPGPSEATNASAACAESSFDFGGRAVENGDATDTWTLTCWRKPVDQAAPVAGATVKPVDAVPVATQPVPPAGDTRMRQRF